MLLIEVKNATNAEEALRIYNAKKAQETTGNYQEERVFKGPADGDIFVTSNGFCYGVIVSESEPDTLNYYAVTSDSKHKHHEKEVESFRKQHPEKPKLLAEIIVHYSDLIKRFEKQHPGTSVLLAAGGARLFYLFITIRGNVEGITDEEVKEHFQISLLERR